MACTFSEVFRNTDNLFPGLQASGGNVQEALGALPTLAIAHLTLPVTPQVNTRRQGPRASSSLKLPLRTTARRSRQCHKLRDHPLPSGAASQTAVSSRKGRALWTKTVLRAPKGKGQGLKR